MSLLVRENIHKAVDLMLDAVDGCDHKGKQRAMALAVERYISNLADVLTKITLIRDTSVTADAQITVADDGTVVIASDIPKADRA